MPELVPIYKNRDLYVPAFDVKIRGNDIPRESLSDIAAELAERVREVQPHGPYLLGGTCLAGWVAFSIAGESKTRLGPNRRVASTVVPKMPDE